MGVKTYEHTTTSFSPETGEITADTKYTVSSTNNEDDYIKVYKYLNTIFAFKGINQNLIPALMEISNYMTYADKGQTVILVKAVKDKIRAALPNSKGEPLSTARLDSIIRQLKEVDILRPTGQRSEYAINPFIIARGKWSDIKELRVQFDAVADKMETKSSVTDKLTGKTINQIVTETKNKRLGTKDDIPGQMTLNDYQNSVQKAAEQAAAEKDNTQCQDAQQPKN